MEEEEVIVKGEDADDSNVGNETKVEENLTSPELPEIISGENSDGSVNRIRFFDSGKLHFE